MSEEIYYEQPDEKYDIIDRWYSYNEFREQLNTSIAGSLKKRKSLIANIISDCGFYISYREILWVFNDDIWVNAQNKIEKFILDIFGEDASIGLLKEITKQIMVRTNIEIIPKITSNFIPLGNCVFNLDTMTPKEYKKSMYIFSKPDVKWVGNAKCPKFDEALREMGLNENEQISIFQFFGYCLLSDYPIKQFMVFYGKANTGKSTIANVLMHLIGENNCSTLGIYTLNNKHATSALVNKLANIAGDTGNLYKVEVLKSITGSDSVSIEPKFEKYYTQRLNTKFLYINNDYPVSDDDAMRFRAVIVPFRHVFERTKNEKYLDFFDEAAGILNKSLVALKLLLQDGQFKMTKYSKDLLADFIDIETKLVDEGGIKLTDLFVAYNGFLKRMGKMQMKNVRNFSMMLKQKGWNINLRSSVNYVSGLILCIPSSG